MPFGLQRSFICPIRRRSQNKTEPSNDGDSSHPYHFVFSDRRATNPITNRSTVNTFVSINQYLLNDFVSPPSFPPPLYDDLLFSVLTKTLEPLKVQSMAMKRNGKYPVSSDSEEKVMFFKDVSLGPHETQLRFRLIHFWEARNPVKKTLIGLEMLLIDEQVSQFSKKSFHSKNSFQIIKSMFPRIFDRLGFRWLF